MHLLGSLAQVFVHRELLVGVLWGLWLFLPRCKEAVCLVFLVDDIFSLLVRELTHLMELYVSLVGKVNIGNLLPWVLQISQVVDFCRLGPGMIMSHVLLITKSDCQVLLSWVWVGWTVTSSSDEAIRVTAIAYEFDWCSFLGEEGVRPAHIEVLLTLRLGFGEQGWVSVPTWSLRRHGGCFTSWEIYGLWQLCLELPQLGCLQPVDSLRHLYLIVTVTLAEVQMAFALRPGCDFCSASTLIRGYNCASTSLFSALLSCAIQDEFSGVVSVKVFCECVVVRQLNHRYQAISRRTRSERRLLVLNDEVLGDIIDIFYNFWHLLGRLPGKCLSLLLDVDIFTYQFLV